MNYVCSPVRSLHGCYCKLHINQIKQFQRALYCSYWFTAARMWKFTFSLLFMKHHNYFLFLVGNYLSEPYWKGYDNLNKKSNLLDEILQKTVFIFNLKKSIYLSSHFPLYIRKIKLFFRDIKKVEFNFKIFRIFPTDIFYLILENIYCSLFGCVLGKLHY